MISAMGIRGAVVLLACAVGCDSGAGGDTYQLTFHGAPALLDVRDGAGAWRSLRLDGDVATATIAAGFHAFAYACLDGNTPRLLEVVHDAGPGATIEVCPRAPALVEISGRVSPSDSHVTMADYEWDADVGGNFTASVPAGTHDIAWSTTFGPVRGGILRDVALAQGTQVDLFASAPPILLPATVTGLGTDDLLVSGSVRTARGTSLVFFNTDPAAVPLAPENLRRPGDVVTVRALATVDQITRQVQRVVTGATLPELALPALGTLTVTRAGFSADAGWNTIYAAITQPTPLGRTLVESATDKWLAASGETTVAWTDAAELPGWDPSWGFLQAGEASGSVGAFDGEANGDHASVSQRITLTW
jgi:hypothetical protein